MASVNKVILVGHLGADPELRYTSTGKSVCNFRIATSQQWTDGQGQKQESVCWHRIVTWGKQGEVCSRYLKKGRQVYIEGRLSQDRYQGEDGKTRVSTEVVSNSVVFLGSRPGDGNGNNGNGDGNGAGRGYAGHFEPQRPAEPHSALQRTDGSSAGPGGPGAAGYQGHGGPSPGHSLPPGIPDDAGPVELVEEELPF